MSLQCGFFFSSRCCFSGFTKQRLSTEIRTLTAKSKDGAVQLYKSSRRGGPALISSRPFQRSTEHSNARSRTTLPLLFLSITSLGLAQHTAPVCNTDDNSDCRMIDTTVIGGLRWEDYKVTNPKAIQFDPSIRLTELAALGPSIAQTLSVANPQAPYIDSAPSISFSNVTATISEVSYTVGNTAFLSEFLIVLISNFSTSDGYSSPMFGFKMSRNRGSSQVYIGFKPGNPGLEQVAGLTSEVGYSIDPVPQTATFVTIGGPVPSSPLLRQALFGIFLNLRQVLSAAGFTTQPAASGQPLWSSSDITSLGTQASSMIANSGNPNVPVGPMFTCTYPPPSGYANCVGRASMDALNNLVLTWGGEYLGLRTVLSKNVLMRNLLAWAKANGPIIDASLQPSDKIYQTLEYAMMEMSKPITMLWPHCATILRSRLTTVRSSTIGSATSFCLSHSFRAA